MNDRMIFHYCCFEEDGNDNLALELDELSIPDQPDIMKSGKTDLASEEQVNKIIDPNTDGKR